MLSNGACPLIEKVDQECWYNITGKLNAESMWDFLHWLLQKGYEVRVKKTWGLYEIKYRRLLKKVRRRGTA